jgi:hypothetical protein
MGILMAAGVASYSRMNDQAKVKQGTESIATQLRAWQKQADSGVGRTHCSGTAYGGLTIEPVLHGTAVTSLQKRVNCGGSLIVDGSEIVAVPNGVIVESFSAFTLLPLGGGVSVATTLTVHNAAESTVLLITLATGGAITVTVGD